MERLLPRSLDGNQEVPRDDALPSSCLWTVDTVSIPYMQDLRFSLLASLRHESLPRHILRLHNRIQLRSIWIQGSFTLLPCESAFHVVSFLFMQPRFRLPASSSLVSWLELFYMSLFPNVSFLGHLSGMLAGYLYIFLFVFECSVMIDRSG